MSRPVAFALTAASVFSLASGLTKDYHSIIDYGRARNSPLQRLQPLFDDMISAVWPLHTRIYNGSAQQERTQRSALESNLMRTSRTHHNLFTPPTPYGPGLYLLNDVCVANGVGQEEAIEIFKVGSGSADSCTSCFDETPHEGMARDWDSCGSFFTRMASSGSREDLTSCLQARADQYDFDHQLPGVPNRTTPRSFKRVEQINEMTLVLATHANIGHILNDVYGSLILLHDRPWQRAWIPANPGCQNGTWGQWGCPVMEALGVIKGGGVLKPQGDLLCFKQLLVPHIAVNRNFNNVDFAPLDVQSQAALEARAVLVQRFVPSHVVDTRPPVVNLSDSAPRELLIFGHLGGDNAQWLDFDSTVSQLKELLLPRWSVTSVGSGGDLSIEEQAALWYAADVVIGPPGAEEANGIFSRNNSVHIEFLCRPESNWGNLAYFFGYRVTVGVEQNACSGDEDIRVSPAWVAKQLEEVLSFEGNENIKPGARLVQPY